MDNGSEFTVTLVSNGSEKYYSDNTLTNFTNQLPLAVPLDESKEWFVSLQDIGIHLNYENISFPKNVGSIQAFDATDLVTDIGENINEIKKVQISNEKKESSGIELQSSSSSSINKFSIVLETDSKRHIISTERLNIKPQLFSLDSIKVILEEFISNSELLRNNLQFQLTTSYVYNIQKLTEEGNYISIKGVREYALENPNVDKAKIRQIRFKNIISTNQEVLSKNYDKKFPIGVLFHSSLFEALELSLNEKVMQTNVDGERYYLIILKSGTSIISPILFEKNFPRLASNICHVHCNIVDAYNFDDKYCKILKTVSLPRTDSYYFNSIKEPQFFKINVDSVKDISIKLTDEKFQNLPLLSGVASIIKLKFKTMERPKISNLKVSSNSDSDTQFNNNNNDFKVKLPPSISFDENNLHLSVSSITFPNKFKTLPSNVQNNIYISILNSDSLSIDSNIKKVNIPEGSYNSSDKFIQSINDSLISKECKSVVFTKLHDIGGTIQEKGGKCMISSKAYTIIALPIHLCILLGIRRDLITLDEKGEYQWKNREIYDRTYVGENLPTRANHYSVSLGKIIQDQFSQSSDLLSTAFFFICLGSKDLYQFDHRIDLYEFRPKYFLLYNNICTHSIFDNSYLKILKIVPVKESNEEYVTIEFENEEYIKIQETHPNYLEFTLRSHSGELIEFHDLKENLIIDLNFKIIK